jgi:hypothetical protein
VRRCAGAKYEQLREGKEALHLHARTREAESVLCAEVSGEMDLPEALGLYERLLERWKGTGTRSILIDCRAVTGTLSDVQRYEAGARLAASYAEVRGWGGVPPRVAIVAVPPLFDRRGFMQTVASNRGAVLGAFETMAEAAAWLDLDPSVLAGDWSPLPG